MSFDPWDDVSSYTIRAEVGPRGIRVAWPHVAQGRAWALNRTVSLFCEVALPEHTSVVEDASNMVDALEAVLKDPASLRLGFVVLTVVDGLDYSAPHEPAAADRSRFDRLGAPNERSGGDGNGLQTPMMVTAFRYGRARSGSAQLRPWRDFQQALVGEARRRG